MYVGGEARWWYEGEGRTTDRVARSKRVFLLGPSHHVYLSGIALSPFAAYGTPVGDIPLDLEGKSQLN